ncbi:MAG: elongation factor P [Planctomycetes bacterium]|nr:elongation factor P [Planctomycetota bacterium]
MPSIPVNSLKRGVTIMYKGTPHVCVGTEHVKPGKGPAYVQAKLKDIKAGRVVENRFNSSDKVEQLFVGREKYQFSYDAGDLLVFMHGETFEETNVARDMLGDRLLYLRSGDEVEFESCDDELVSINLPKVVVHEITETPPALKGATATNQLKPAETETGLQVKVPPFIAIGDKIRIDTETGGYLERAKGD